MPETAKLSDFAFINPATDTNGTAAEAPVAFIPMAAVAEGGGWRSTENRPLSDARRGYTLFQRGDVIVAKITPCFENGKVALLSVLETDFGLGSTEFHVLRAKPGHDPRFIYHWTRHPAFLRAGEASMTGSAGQRRVPAGFFERFEIARIEGAPQGLIADILDAIDETVLETEAIIEKLLAIRVGFTEDLLTFGIGSDGRPGSRDVVAETSLGPVPSSWSRGNLGSIAEAITSGSRGWARYYSDTGAKFLRIGNLTRQHINLRLDDLVYVTPPKGQEGSRTAVRENDLLISITADLGIIGSIPPDFGEAYVNQHISLVRLKENAVNPRWPAHFLSSRRAQIMFQKLNDQGAKAGINLPAVGQIQVPLPPREEQDAIVERLDAADEEIARYRIERAKLSSLREGLRDDLLTGQKPVVAIREAAE
jgi:type I restriction enzyme S subunit